MEVGKLYGLPKVDSPKFVCFRHCNQCVVVNDINKTIERNEEYYLLIAEETLLVHRSNEYPFVPLEEDKALANSIMDKFSEKRAERTRELVGKEEARKQLIARMASEYLFLKQRLDVLNQEIRKLKDVNRF